MQHRIGILISAKDDTFFSLCMFVCEQENSKRCRQFLIKKIFGGVGSVTKGTADYISVVVFFVFFYFLYFWFLHFFSAVSLIYGSQFNGNGLCLSGNRGINTMMMMMTIGS